MFVSAIHAPAARSDIRAILEDWQDEATLLVLAVLVLTGALLLGTVGPGPVPDSLTAMVRQDLPGLILFLLPAPVWLLHRRSRLAAGWALVVGTLAADLLFATQSGAIEALFLLALPAGLAALFVSPLGGVLVALACSILLFQAPAAALPAGSALRSVATAGVWGTVGLIWLTVRPLLGTLEWSWASYAQSRRSLEQARDYQVQLKQTLADLAAANLQFARLNRLAQGLRQAAEEARQVKEQFVANVSHELRTPLNMIIGFSEMIVKNPTAYGAALPRALLADLNVILRNSQHLSSLIDDVLDLSQIEAGRMALIKERVALPEVVEAAITAVRPLYQQKGLYLRTEIEPDLPLVFCDPTRMREVLLNLLSNAGRFTERGGVTVCLRRERDEIECSVIDTGPGIADRHQQELFQPFKQLDGSARRLHGGSGLGLSISKAFVELHGGRMGMESVVGVGTTFHFRLPIDPPAPITEGDVPRWFSPYWHYEERTQRSQAPVAKAGPRFVILENGNTLQRLLGRYLEGAELVAVDTLDQALQELNRVPAQALLVNDVSIAQATQRLGAITLPDGTTAIACSLPGDQERATSLGIADYLVKPISLERLLAALDRLAFRGKRILVVDDEPEAQQLFQRMLTAVGRGYRVLRADDGRTALEVLRREGADLVLLDLAMPNMDGFRFLEARSQDPALADIPIIMTSARDPAGQPIVSSGLSVVQGGGLSVAQLLACLRAITGILAPGGLPAGPTPPAESFGSPVSG